MRNRKKALTRKGEMIGRDKKRRKKMRKMENSSFQEALKNCLSCLKVEESYQLARRMEKEKTNPILGYRTAGSLAERKTGDMLVEEMKKAGLVDVHKDKITVDAWEFKKAVMRYQTKTGEKKEIQLGAYQTDFKTDGFERFDLVYLKKGTAKDYENIDVKGKLVLIEINQREEWWINYPVYQAHLKGAKALIAVQSRGYAQIDDTALNAQDIAGPASAPAFSMSRADFLEIWELMQESKNENKKENSVPHLLVELDAETKVEKDQYTYNIVGKIPGRRSDSMILLSAHYDSYFEGFQDDNAAVAMIIGIAKALIQGGYQPNHTIVVCALAAEEWGISDTKYDWSTGAYRQVFEARADWPGNVIADFNFELPAHAHSTKDAIRCTYEYVDFIQKFVDKDAMPKGIYPDGMTTLYPIETWSDDFTMAISGIPSFVNDFSGGPFMENYYHSQYDNQDVYEEEIYQFHHEFYLKLLMAVDALALPPLNFATVLTASMDSLDLNVCKQTGAEGSVLLEQTKKARETAICLYEKIQSWNQNFGADGDWKRADAITKKLLAIFKKAQDYFVRLDWDDGVIFPQQAVQNNLHALKKAKAALNAGNIDETLDAFYSIDNNCYAFEFEKEVFYHFTEYIMKQESERLMWGKGRILHHENLYELVERLKNKEIDKDSLELEQRQLEEVWERQCAYYKDDIEYLIRAVTKFSEMLQETVVLFEKN